MQKPPGLERDEAEHAALEAAFHMMPAGYKPRTHLWHEGQPAYINRLIHEGSPYLLQHAHNPVDWWPWGEEALAAAKRQDKPIFLSAGYATCHWCHVMEEESFDNAIVAEALNRDYIPVKLDREQRPDIDQIYVLATTLQHRHAGWPNSVWLFADGRPFHTGTYFQRPHFLQLLEAIATAWKGEGRTELDAFATNLAEGVRRASARAE
ncbi:MAG: thioredoxin domain-containing protein, partial [Pseudomonadota bacterium]